MKGKKKTFYTPFKKGIDHILYGKPAWNRGKKMPHSKEWEEKRLSALRKAVKGKIYPKGYHRPAKYLAPMQEALKKWKLVNPEKARELSIKNLPKTQFGERNFNWRGGITEKNYSWRLAHYAEYLKWRELILSKSGNRCVNCGSTERLEACHIFSIDSLKETAFELWNGVCLCRECHKKTNSWGGKKKKDNKDNKGEMQVIAQVIPHKWQEYETVGNWKILGSGLIALLISDMGDFRYNILVLVHELIETILCKHRGIKEFDVTDFDIKFEERRKLGLETDEAEPGDDKKAPYYKEHQFATKIERMLAKQLGVSWKQYDQAVQDS